MNFFLLIALILFGIPSACIAAVKGFKWIRWIFALGFIGLLVVACLPTAKAENITTVEAMASEDTANTAGAWLATITVAINLIITFMTQH